MRVAELRVGVLMYFVGSENIHALLLDQQGHLKKFQLAPCKQTFVLLSELFEDLERGSLSVDTASSRLQSFCFEWGQTLLPPAESLEGLDILVIIPHHSLHGVPFHIIWLEEKAQFLATAYGLSYCSSATLFTRCLDRNRARQFDLGRWEFALADPQRATGPPPPKRCLGMGVDIIGDQTPLYSQLANSFAAEFEDPVSLQWATRGFKNRLQRGQTWEVVCIACHGYYDPRSPDNSGLLLEKEPGIVIRPIFLHGGTYYDFRDLPFKYLPAEIEPSREAELMTVNELMVDCSTDAQLIALFGCSTGAGHLVSADDFNSMAYQWLKAGAPSVLANLWELDINFAHRWSPLFLDNWLHKRQPKAVAWQQTLKELLDNSPGIDPFEWGPLALFGDWL